MASQVVQVVTNLPANEGHKRDSGSVPGLGRSSGEGNGTLLQYLCLGNPMYRGAGQVIVYGVTESDATQHHTQHI